MAHNRSFIYENKQRQSNGFCFFNEMKQKEIFCDVTFTVEQKQIRAHRLIVAAAIPGLYDYLKDRENSTESIPLTNTNLLAFESLVEYAYTGRILINEENVENLLIGALRFEVIELVQECCDFAADFSVCLENVLSWLILADELGCIELATTCEHLIATNFAQVHFRPDFLRDCTFSILRSVISREELQVPNQRVVYEAVMNWVRRLADERCVYLLELLKLIRIQELERTYLQRHVISDPLVLNSRPCRDFLVAVIKSLPDERASIQPDQTKSSSSERRGATPEDIYAV